MTPRTYGISPRRRNVLLAIGLVLTIPLALAGLVLSESALLVSAGIVTAILVPIFAVAINSARLHVSDDGVELRQLGWRMATPWDNVAGLRMVRGREGLVLHQPLTDRGAERLDAAASMRISGSSLFDAEQQQLIAEHRFIPIEAFAYWLEHGDLRTILTEHVPALAVPDAFTPVAPTKLPRRRMALIAVIIAAAVAAGLALAFASPEMQARAERLLMIPVALAMGTYAIVNVVAALRYLRRGNYGWCALWLMLAMLQALVVMAILGDQLSD